MKATIVKPPSSKASPSTPLEASPPKRTFWVLLLLLAGACWWMTFPGDLRLPLWIYGGMLIIVVFAALADFSKGQKADRTRLQIQSLLDKVRHPSSRTQWLIAAGLILVSILYLYATAIYLGRSFGPKWHDEFSFSLQAQIFASGHLWMPQHPLADFFDTFYVLARPVYAPERFPGLTLMLVPGVWLRWPMWVTPLLISGGCVGLLYLVMTQLVDGLFGLLAALLLVAGVPFRTFSTMIMAQLPVILLGLGLILVWLHWRKSRRLGWMALMGALGGWLAITRPLDAICYLAPVAVAVLVDLRPWRWKQIGLSALLALAAAAPFLALQLTLDVGITGRLLQTPFSYYNQRDEPELTFGFSHPTDREPLTVIPQKRIFYDQTMRPWVRQYTPHVVVPQFFHFRLPTTVGAALPQSILILLVPVGLLGLTDRKRWVLFATIILFLGLYTFYPTFTFYHPLVTLPATILLLGLALRRIEGTLPSHRLIGVLVPAGAVALLCLSTMPPWNRQPGDACFEGMSQSAINAQLDEIPSPAVVLFRFTPGCNPETEPVYNIHTAWPDDARIIRAHDLGPRDAEIIAYYAARQPARLFYLYDRASHRLIYLNTAAALNEGLHKMVHPGAAPGTRP
jgi:hypothetical protein